MAIGSRYRCAPSGVVRAIKSTEASMRPTRVGRVDSTHPGGQHVPQRPVCTSRRLFFRVKDSNCEHSNAANLKIRRKKQILRILFIDYSQNLTWLPLQNQKFDLESPRRSSMVRNISNIALNIAPVQRAVGSRRLDVLQSQLCDCAFAYSAPRPCSQPTALVLDA